MTRRVLHITNIPTPYRLPQLNAMARQFAEVDWHLKVVFGGAGYGRRKWAIDLSSCEFEYEMLAGAVTSADAERTVFLYRGLYRVLYAYQPHVVISTGYSIATTKAMLWSFVFGTPYLIFSGSTHRTNGRWQFLRLLQRRALIARAAGGIAYGSQAKEYLHRLGMPPSDIHVAINTVDTRYFRDRTLELREDARSSDARRTLLYIGDLTRRKRVEAVLRTAARLSQVRDDFRLVIVGDGPERQYLEELSRQLSIQSFVCFDGFRQNAELPRYFASADCFLFPTRYDIWGLVLNEAMAAGVPCVASVHAGATADLIRHGITGFAADFGNVEEVAGHVHWILNNPGEAAEMGVRASNYVRKHAGLELSAAGFVEAVLRAGGVGPSTRPALPAAARSRKRTPLTRRFP